MPNRRKPPAVKQQPFPTPSNRQVRVKAEMWADVFFGSIDTLIAIEGDMDGEEKKLQQKLETNGDFALRIVDRAHAIADFAIDTYERRWPGVLINP